jgi:hypothetical protein
MKHKTKINSKNERVCVIPVRQLTDGIPYSGNNIPVRQLTDEISHYGNEIPTYVGMTGHCNSFGLMHTMNNIFKEGELDKKSNVHFLQILKNIFYKTHKNNTVWQF